MSHPSLHTHIPECNSSMTHNQILCRSNHPHPSLTSTLSHCIITLLQEKPATLHQPQCTEYQEYKLHTLATCPIFWGHLRGHHVEPQSRLSIVVAGPRCVQSVRPQFGARAGPAETVAFILASTGSSAVLTAAETGTGRRISNAPSPIRLAQKQVRQPPASASRPACGSACFFSRSRVPAPGHTSVGRAARHPESASPAHGRNRRW